MKKRLLITSIVMMLVVAVALSTATYAWFTSNTTVTASSITMYASTSNTASIGISWTDGAGENSHYGTSITANGPASTTKFEPAAISSVTANTALDEIKWTSATLKDEAGVATFNNDLIDTSAQGKSIEDLCYVWKGTGADTNTHDSFFIHNGSVTNTLSDITASVTITGDAASFIRVAFFKKDGANGFKLKGIICDEFVYAPVEANATSVLNTDYYDVQGNKVLTGDGTTPVPANSFTRSNNTAQTVAYGEATGALSSAINSQSITNAVSLGGLNRDDSTVGGDDIMELKVIAWMDGTALNDTTAGNGKNSTIALKFVATKGAYVADTFGGAAPAPEQGD